VKELVVQAVKNDITVGS